MSFDPESFKEVAPTYEEFIAFLLRLHGHWPTMYACVVLVIHLLDEECLFVNQISVGPNLFFVLCVDRPRLLFTGKHFM